jgi:hypothetical protein
MFSAGALRRRGHLVPTYPSTFTRRLDFSFAIVEYEDSIWCVSPGAGRALPRVIGVRRLGPVGNDVVGSGNVAPSFVAGPRVDVVPCTFVLITCKRCGQPVALVESRSSPTGQRYPPQSSETIPLIRGCGAGAKTEAPASQIDSSPPGTDRFTRKQYGRIELSIWYWTVFSILLKTLDTDFSRLDAERALRHGREDGCPLS